VLTFFKKVLDKMEMIDFWCYENGDGKIVKIQISSECCGIKIKPTHINVRNASYFSSSSLDLSYCRVHMSSYNTIWDMWGKNKVNNNSTPTIITAPTLLYRTVDPYGNIDVIKIPSICCGHNIKIRSNNNLSLAEGFSSRCDHFANYNTIWKLYGHTAMLKLRSCIKCGDIIKAIPNQSDDKFICYSCSIGNK
jgi:hypothetical protein